MTIFVRAGPFLNKMELTHDTLPKFMQLHLYYYSPIYAYIFQTIYFF